MKTKLIGLALVGVFGIASSVVMADDAYQGSMYVVPSIGYVHTDSDLEADNDVAYGIRLGKELSPHWDVQVGLSYTKPDANNRIGGLAASGDYKQTLFGIDALYMFSRDSFRPFLLAGFGAAHNNIDYTIGGANVGDSNTSWMGNVGAGFQYYFTDNIGLQADLRHVWSRAKSNPSVAGFNMSGTEAVGNTYLNLGLVFNFGAPRKVAAAAVQEPISAMADIAPVEEEAIPPLSESVAEPEQVIDYGPDKPAFEKLTLQAEVLFDFDRGVLKSEGKKIIDAEVTGKMKAHPEVELVLIVGHTDRIGDANYNQKLSERRAESVRKYLVSQGIEDNRLHAVGKGESQPVDDCKGVRGKKLIECLQPNRRVVVEVEVQRATQK